MDRAATADARARSSLSKAEEHMKSGDVKEAIEALAAHLLSNQLTAIGFQCLELLADLSINHEKPETDKLIEVLRRCRSGLRGSQHLEDSVQRIVDLVMSRIRQMCVSARERAEALESNPSDGDRMLAALNGTSLAALAEARHIQPCHRALSRLIRHFCGVNSIGFAKKLTFIYNKTVRQFLSICKEFNAAGCLLDVSRAVSRTISHMAFDHIIESEKAYLRVANQDRRKERADFLASTAAVTEVVETLCCLLNDICSLRQYGSALDVLSCLKHLCDTVERKEGLTDVVSGAYETMSDIFWTCSLYNYHAHCLCTAASLKRHERRGPLAARAVIASLCVTEADLELDPFGRHRKKNPDIDELFFFPSTTKSSLLEQLKAKNVFNMASAEIVKLTASLEDPNFSDFTGLHKSVTALTTANGDLSRYNDELHKVILRYQLECLAVSCNHGDLLALSAYNGNLTTAEYVNNIEPLILDDDSVSVEIDSRTNTLSFSNASKAKMLSYFTKIVADVDTVPASSRCASAGRYSDFTQAGASPSRKPVTVTAADLDAASARSLAIFQLQKACIDNKETRAKNKIESEEKRRADAVQERMDQEEKKKKETQEAYIAQLYPEYRERQRQERGKEVLRKLRVKYPGFKVDDAIVYRSAAGFEDELTRLLAAFKRRGVENDRKDILQANLYERAVRALEIPARKAVDAENAERNRAERAAVRANYLAEHRNEYDRRCNERKVLSKFLEDAERFEAKWLGQSSGAKLSKREEEQLLLEQELRRLAES